MKITNLRIKSLLLSVLAFVSAQTLSAQVVVSLTDDQKAEYYEIVTTRDDAGAGTTGTLGEKPGRYYATILSFLDGDDKVIMNMVDGDPGNGVGSGASGAEDEYLPTTAIDVGEIYVESWYINNGTAEQTFDISSMITGAGDIFFETWDTDSAPAHNVYKFTGDMSNYGGDIKTSTMGGLSLQFNGSTRGTLIVGDAVTGTGGGVAGRGAIETYANGMNQTASAVTFGIAAGGTSYVTNSSIAAHNINFNTSDYGVTSALLARNALSVGAGASVTMLDGSSVTVGSGASLSVNATGSLTFNSGSSLIAATGTTISSALTMEGGAILDLVAGSSTSLTLGDFSWKNDTSGILNLQVSAATSFVGGLTYNLLSMDMTGFTDSNFTVSLDGLDSSAFEWSIAGDMLSVTILTDAQTLEWNGVDGAVWSTTDTNNVWNVSGGSAANFTDADLVGFGTASGAKTVTITGNVSPGLITVDSDSDYSFSGSGAITGAAALTKSGSGTLSISTSNSYSGGTILNEGTLSINSMDALGTGDLSINGGVLAVHGGGTVALDADRMTLGRDVALRVELNGTSASLSDASSLGDHALYVTGNAVMRSTPTLTHDSWDSVSSVDIGAGATVDFGTSSEVEEWETRGLSGAGTLVTSHGAALKNFVVATSSADGDFTGTIKAVNGADVSLVATHDNATSRLSLDGTVNSQYLLLNQGSFDTFYLKSLSGTGSIVFNATLPGETGVRKTVDLQMEADQSYAGRFYNDDSRMGNFVVSSVAGKTYNLTLTGAGYTTPTSAPEWHQMHVSNASVILSGENATWGGVIDLKDANAKLVFDHSVAYLRAAAEGKITGAGSVEIVSTHGVTLSRDSDYTGGTTVKAGASLTLNSAAAAGSGEIELEGNATLGVANGLTVANALSLTGSNTITGNATLSGDVTLHGSASLTATGTVNLSGALLVEEGETLTLQSGTFNFSHATIDASALSITDGADVTIESSTLTGIQVSDAIEREFTTSEGGTEMTPIYTISNVAHVLNEASTGITLDLGDIEDFDFDRINAFVLDEVSSLPFWYGFINLKIGDEINQVLGETTTGLDGNSYVVLYIPEPSSVTLSLLALTGLLARRRRRG